MAKASKAAGDVPEGQPTPEYLIERGSTGLKRSGGMITEEFLPELMGDRGRRAYRLMSDNEPVIGGALLAIKEIVGRLDWEFSPPEDPTPEEQAQRDFVQECFEDMSDSWDVTLSQILSMLPYGWSYFEVVMKVRMGQQSDPAYRSRFNDGRVGWRKFAIRSQDTLSRWVFDDNGGLRGMVQLDPNGGGQRAIPIERALLFRTDEYKGNPEGRSMLRNAYRAWYYKTHLEEIEAIGVERDLAGMPIGYAPVDWFPGPNKAADPNLAIVQEAVKHAKRNEVDGLVLPSIIDDRGNRLLDFKLLTSGGTRQMPTNEVIGRWNNAIVTSLLMDFLTLGHEGVGSWALGTAKISMWQMVVDSIAKSVASVINKHAVPRLLRFNGWVPDRMPQLTYGDVAQADLAVLGAFLQQMIQTGAIVPDEALEAHVRVLAGLPPVDGRGRV